MLIAIRSGIRYRLRYAFCGDRLYVMRYEREHAPTEWMFIIVDEIGDFEMEVDGEDAWELEAVLEAAEDEPQSVEETEANVRAWAAKQ